MISDADAEMAMDPGTGSTAASWRSTVHVTVTDTRVAPIAGLNDNERHEGEPT